MKSNSICGDVKIFTLVGLWGKSISGLVSNSGQSEASDMCLGIAWRLRPQLALIKMQFFNIHSYLPTLLFYYFPSVNLFRSMLNSILRNPMPFLLLRLRRLARWVLFCGRERPLLGCAYSIYICLVDDYISSYAMDKLDGYPRSG